MKKVIIAGGTGLVGTRLTELLLKKGYKVCILSRTCNFSSNETLTQLTKEYQDQLSCNLWDTDTQTITDNPFADAYAVINLAGAGIADKRWTTERKEEILKSRVNANKTIISALTNKRNDVSVVVNSSAIGWYGDDISRPELIPFKEETTPTTDFLGKVCQFWEQSILPVQVLGKRLCILRIGIVLSNDGGAYKEFKRTLNLRVASVLGNGKQIVSWIHIDDLCHLFIHSIENENMNGVYNAVAPYSVTNKKLVSTIGEKIHKSNFAQMSVPKAILKITLGELSTEVLKSCLVSARKVLDTGFKFEYKKIKDAVDNLEHK